MGIPQPKAVNFNAHRPGTGHFVRAVRHRKSRAKICTAAYRHKVSGSHRICVHKRAGYRRLWHDEVQKILIKINRIAVKIQSGWSRDNIRYQIDWSTEALAQDSSSLLADNHFIAGN